jgi:hypothetical protein
MLMYLLKAGTDVAVTTLFVYGLFWWARKARR